MICRCYRTILSLTKLIYAISMDYHCRNSDIHNFIYTTNHYIVERNVEQKLMYKFTEIDIDNYTVLHSYTTRIYRIHILENII